MDHAAVNPRLRAGLEIAAIVLLIFSTMLEAQLTFLLAAVLIVVVLALELRAHRHA